MDVVRPMPDSACVTLLSVRRRGPTDADRDAAELVEQVKWAAQLPYDRMGPEMQAFWRRLARALKRDD